MLFFFTRHGEESRGGRVEADVFWLSAAVERTVAKAREWMNAKPFGEIKNYQGLRQIRAAGESVRNYRLYPPEGLVLPEHGGFTSDPVNVVHQADKVTGETLSDLFGHYGTGGTRLLWLPCRAVFGHEGSLVDAGDFANGQEVIGCTL